MKKSLLPFLALLLISITVSAQKLALDKWKYIEVDNSRQKWGDWGEPDWLRYFGLDMMDINKDGFLDIVSGRYFYMNPGGNMEGHWKRSNLGMNVDGYLFVDVDGDQYADVIAEALPDIWWFEANDRDGNSWTGRKIGSIPQTDHTNGQGGRHAQLIKGGKEEIILAAEGGIYAAQIPGKPDLITNWKFNRIIRTGSSEGIGVGDIDGDGDLDIACGDISKDGKKELRVVNWLENPGTLDREWVKHPVGMVINAADRFEITDFNGDGKGDIAVSEEMWPGLEPLANLFVFFNPGKGTKWERTKLFTGFSLNNLDAGDLDNDGDVDLITIEHKGKEFRRLLFENDGKGNFKMSTPDRGHESHLGARLADLDSDGDLDVVSIAWDNYKFLHAWRNDAIKK